MDPILAALARFVAVQAAYVLADGLSGDSASIAYAVARRELDAAAVQSRTLLDAATAPQDAPPMAPVPIAEPVPDPTIDVPESVAEEPQS